MSKKNTTPQKMTCLTESNMQHQNKLVLSKGMEVEVTSNDEGFKGVWYTGTIINPPKKTRNKALVEFHNLVTKDGSKPLRELTDIALIRPLPPPFDACNNMLRTFEENDVVDAFYNDGWWIGVVCRVLRGDRFLVYFDSPPDVMEFGVHNLRVHQDWHHGKWVQSEKQHNQQSTKSIFSSGQEVEVNLDEDATGDIWYTAIFIKEFQGSFLLKYKSPRDGDEPGSHKIMVKSLRKIRPIPPCVDRDYELSEKVESFYEFGWRVGEVAKVLSDRRYEVVLELNQESVQLDHTKLRPHMRWIGGKWISKFETVTSTKDTKKRKKIPPNLKLKMPEALKSGKVVTRGAATVTLLCANEVVTSELGPSIGSVSVAEEATYENEEVNTDNKKRRRRTSLPNIMSHVHLELGDSSKKAKKKCQTCWKAKGHEMAAAGSSNTPTDDNTPLSMLPEGTHSHAGTEMPRLLCYKKADQHKEAPLESCSTNDPRGNASYKNTSPLFVKRSPVWKTVESMEVFKMMPQKPHFLPLSKYKEDYREGNAIGMMVTFACIAEKVSNLRFDDPRSSFDGVLESLPDLENHGFDVDSLKTHVRELLGLKDRLSQLQEEARVSETRIKKLTKDKVKFSNEIESIEMEINVLQERLLVVNSGLEKGCHDIASLRSGLRAINEDIHDTMLEFDKLVGSPF